MKDKFEPETTTKTRINPRLFDACSTMLDLLLFGGEGPRRWYYYSLLLWGDSDTMFRYLICVCSSWNSRLATLNKSWKAAQFWHRLLIEFGTAFDPSGVDTRANIY